MALLLKVVGGKYNGQEFRYSQKKKCFIGRADDCDLCLKSEHVNQYHCALAIDEPEVVVRDLGSREGTYVNGTRISGPEPLSTGDVISVGPLKIEITVTTLKAGDVDSKASKPVPSGDALQDVPLPDTTADTKVLHIAPIELCGPAPMIPPPKFPAGPPPAPVDDPVD